MGNPVIINSDRFNISCNRCKSTNVRFEYDDGDITIVCCNCKDETPKFDSLRRKIKILADDLNLLMTVQNVSLKDDYMSKYWADTGLKIVLSKDNTTHVVLIIMTEVFPDVQEQFKEEVQYVPGSSLNLCYLPVVSFEGEERGRCTKLIGTLSELVKENLLSSFIIVEDRSDEWSEEYGRTYTESVLFGNDELFTKEDFEIIAKRQHDIDLETMKNSNKICFFDSDALITKFYLDRYLGETSDVVDSYIDPKKYDLVLLFTPSVKWVDDGLRLDPDNSERWKNHNKIARMYKDYGFTNIIEINEDTYYNRLKAAKNIIKEMWGI
jgi:nicotinamide riboside kinase